jgi:alkylation response protein AidB-like acyl-CoA dehydrogenase
VSVPELHAARATRTAAEYLAAVQTLAPEIAAAGAWGDRERRLPAALIARMASAGLFQMVLSPSIGGGGAGLRTFLEVTETVAAQDGSTAWCLVQGALSAAQVAPFLPLRVAREIFAPASTILANGTGPSGRAVRVEGGYRLTGEWRFASGCTHATWFKGASLVYEADGTPVRQPDGAHDHRTFLFPASDAEVVDVWHVSGLRGTGSNTIRVADLFVPQERSVSLTHDPLQERFLLAMLPYSTGAAAGFCAVALGIARGALDAFEALAAEKTPRGMPHALRESAVVQAQVARAEAEVRAARAFLYQMVDDVWRTVEGGEPLSPKQRALFRLAATSGIERAAGVVDGVYRAAGATAIFESQPFERRFRDVHAVTQQVQAHERHFQTVGRVVLGLEPDTSYV